MEENIKNIIMQLGISEPVFWAAAGALAMLIFQKLLRILGIAGRRDAKLSGELTRATFQADKTTVPGFTLTNLPQSSEYQKINLDNETTNIILQHLGKGDKIQAIKVFREATGTDLKTAKDSVESLERLLVTQHK